jgi:hypothetical protein
MESVKAAQRASIKPGRERLRTAVATAVFLCAAQAATAAEVGTAGQSLEQAASDPTASLMSVSVQNIYAGSYHQLDDESGNTLLLRSSVPFTTGSLAHIARATLPVVTDSPSGESGLSDLVLFDLIKFEKSWGRWGVGPVLLAPTATEDAIGAGKWAIGPAVGFVARSDKLMWGLFNQNLFSFAGDSDREDVNVSILQPILNYSLPNKWSVGTSEMNVTYDWDRDAWTALPLGVKLAKLVKFGKLPVQFAGGYEYNFADDYVAPKWTVNLSVKFLFPI